NGTLLQQTTKLWWNHAQVALAGIVHLESGTQFSLQYARKGGSIINFTVSDPIDGESMRTGQVTVFRIADPLLFVSGALDGGISGINVSGSGVPVDGNPYANLNFTGAG